MDMCGWQEGRILYLVLISASQKACIIEVATVKWMTQLRQLTAATLCHQLLQDCTLGM